MLEVGSVLQYLHDIITHAHTHALFSHNIILYDVLRSSLFISVSTVISGSVTRSLLLSIVKINSLAPMSSFVTRTMFRSVIHKEALG